MGGSGSGRRPAGGTKEIVERARALHITHLRAALTVPAIEAGYTGTARWSCMGQVVAEVCYVVDRRHALPTEVQLYYTLPATLGRAVTTRHYTVGVTSTRPHFGGLRWWWVCPVCQRRVGVLYYPPGAQQVACRRCYGLTYESSQDSHKNDGLYCAMGLDPAKTAKMMAARSRALARFGR